MYAFLLAILVLDGLFLSVVILLQSGKGGGLAAMGGGAAATDGIMGGRQATTLLTRASWISGAIFLVLALILSIMSSRAAQPTSILRDGVQPAAQPAPVLPGLDGAEVAPSAEGEVSGGEGDATAQGDQGAPEGGI
jgi:preprotein translocase subunit SecG